MATLKSLHDKAWKLKSKIVRIKAEGKCFTCPVQKDWKEMDAGHFRHNKCDFDEINIQCQCSRCNRFLNGNLGIYAVNLISKYGKDKVDELILRSNQPDFYSYEDYENMIKDFKQQLKELI